MRFRGENPVYSRVEYRADLSDSATYKGVASKTLLMLLITTLIAIYTMTSTNFDNLSFTSILGPLIVAPILGYIMVIMAHKQEHLSFMYALLYAIFEGVFLGFITLLVSLEVGNVGISYALLGTFGTMFGMLLVHMTGLIEVGHSFKSFIFSALISLIVVSLVFYFFFYAGAVSAQYGMGIYATIIIVSIALSAAYLLYDFNRISEYVNAGASRSHEWSLSLGLMVTLVWLYVDLLRLVYVIMRKR